MGLPGKTTCPGWLTKLFSVSNMPGIALVKCVL